MRIADAGKDINFGLRRLEWIAVVLFSVNLILMLYSMAIYSGDKSWAFFAVSMSTATAVILLLSLLFSIFGRSAYSRLALAAAIVGTMISVMSLGIRIMKEISDWGPHFY
jgi:fumarate reductase subunit C